MTGKISRLPHELRQQLNQRLADGQTGKTILPWLNSIPEVQALLADSFDGQPINDQNLSDYRTRGFRRWEMRQAALEFATDEAADPPPASQVAASPLVDHLVHWIATRFAAAAHNAPIPEDSQADLREIRNFLSDIVALRRGDLVARRLSLEQQRLALGQAKSQAELEKTFWEWTQRPDIQAKLYPHRDPDKARRDAVRFLDQHLLGVRSAEAPPEPALDPAALV
jgi:hypothetical protein